MLPSNEQENRDLKKIMLNLRNVTYIHLRATDIDTEGHWIDMATGEKVLYTHWKPGQPDNWGGIMHNAIIDRNGNWIDEKDWFSAHPLCQKVAQPGIFSFQKTRISKLFRMSELEYAT